MHIKSGYSSSILITGERRESEEVAWIGRGGRGGSGNRKPGGKKQAY